MLQKEPLTERQKQVLDYIEGYIGKNGIAPYLREIADAFNMKIGSVQWIIGQLELKGHIRKNHNKFRGMTLL